ncbi:hypothetical protein [Streptacidiphilus albus]|uniref:hypothetical protein n=1 Tax=Streptacidiphilus albus TaxID=105425 RepID=UPI00054BE1BA|nr:hypothetical protein [Streptacidiphilus albus]
MPDLIPADVAEQIKTEVIRKPGAIHAPHHAPLFGPRCQRCPPAVCSPCENTRLDGRWNYHGQCTGLSWPTYAESHIWWTDRDRIDDVDRWVDGPWQLWLKPRTCECGCDPAAVRAEQAASRERARRLTVLQPALF